MKCLVTKLQGTADNNNLPKFGEKSLLFDVNSDVLRIDVKFIENVLVRVDGNAYFTDSTGQENLGQTLSITANTLTSIYIKSTVSETVRLYFDASKLRQLGSTTPNIVDVRDVTVLRYSPIDTLYCEITSGSKNLYQNIPKSITYLSCVQVSGWLEATTTQLSEYVNLALAALGGVIVTGDISALSTLTKVNTLRFNGPANSVGVYGEVNDLIRGMISNGRTSGTIAMRFLINGNVKLNNSSLTNQDVSATITNSTHYSVTNGSNSYAYVKNGDNWELQS